jgi:hypothetical protein
MCKNKTFFHFFSAKNKPVESTDREAVWKSEFLWLIIYNYSSTSDVMSCDVCRKAGPDIAGKTEFVTGKKKLKRESLVNHNKSQKYEKCFNMVSAKAHFLTYTSTVLAPLNHLQV